MIKVSIKLNQSGIDGEIGVHLLHHLCNADELCLISLSFAGMQKLLDMCSTYATEHILILTYNGSKSYLLCLSLNILNFIDHIFI